MAFKCATLVVSAVCCLMARPAAAQLSIERNEHTIRVSDGGSEILCYNIKPPPLPEGVDPAYHRSGFLHPVRTPSGFAVTAAYPADHRHQDGIFTAWVRTKWNGREIDFWNLAGGTGRVEHRSVRKTHATEELAQFEVLLNHKATEPPVTDVLQERWQVAVHRTDGSYRCFDLTSEQTALTKHPLIVQKYHYGGFAVRGPTDWVLPRSTDEAGRASVSRMMNDQASDRLDGNHQPARWVSMSGRTANGEATITVLSHPDNFRAPQPARLHPTKPYFCFAACVNGEFVIDADHPLVSRYRYLVTDGPPKSEWIERQFESWVQRGAAKESAN